MNWTLIISGLIEHDFKRVWKFEAGMDWQIGWVGKGAGILIVGLVLWVLTAVSKNRGPGCIEITLHGDVDTRTIEIL